MGTLALFWLAASAGGWADLIRVKVNRQPVAEHAGDPARARRGPIGLQLRDRFSVAMFRDIRIREISR